MWCILIFCYLCPNLFAKYQQIIADVFWQAKACSCLVNSKTDDFINIGFMPKNKNISFMKKFITISLIAFWALAMSARTVQSIYTKVRKYDKFDDVVYEKTIKTLITKTDDKIIFETKGSKPVEYYYFDNDLFAINNGSRDSVVNLVNDIYGYEVWYTVFPEDTMGVVRNIIHERIKDFPESTPDTLLAKYKDLSLKKELLDRECNAPDVVFRKISTSSFRFMYDTDLVWIRFKDGSRIIYSKR